MAAVSTKPAGWDPWRHLARYWPEVTVLVVPMSGSLLGELRYPVILLRPGTTTAQQRCTLAHEIAHLERGLSGGGPWAEREERAVHAAAARRLIDPTDLGRALREIGGRAETSHVPALAAALAVDLETMRLRLELLTEDERREIRAAHSGDLWSAA